MSSPDIVGISESVGNGGKNRPSDVMTVQSALNRFSGEDGGPLIKLVVDGICKDLTIKAIYRLQKKWGISAKSGNKYIDVYDGRVDKGGPTWERLQKGPGAYAYTAFEEFQRSKSQTYRIFMIGLRAATVLKQHFNRWPGPANPLFDKSIALAALERSFKISKSKNKVGLVNFIYEKINIMKLNLDKCNDEKTIILVNEPDYAAGFNAIAYAFPGGFMKSGPTDPPWHRHDQHKIYFCAIARVMSDIGISYAITHELSHYVDPWSRDFAYFHRSERQFNALGPREARHNADSFAQFMFECAGHPRFNVGRQVIA